MTVDVPVEEVHRYRDSQDLALLQQYINKKVRANPCIQLRGRFCAEPKPKSIEIASKVLEAKGRNPVELIRQLNPPRQRRRAKCVVVEGRTFVIYLLDDVKPQDRYEGWMNPE